MQHSYVIRGNVHIVYLLLYTCTEEFKGASKLLAQGSIPTREK